MHIVIDARIRRASTGRYVDRLIDHLQSIDNKNSYTVLLQNDDPWEPASQNFRIVRVPYAQFSFNPLEQISFARLLYRLKADLVHFPMTQQPLFYLRPVVTTTMDLTMLTFTRAGKTPLPIFWLKMAGYRFLFWYANRKSKHIITISNYVKEQLSKKYSFTKDKTTTTYCASEPPLKATAQKPTFLGKDQSFILYVGAAFPHKNLEKLVEGFEQLAAKNLDLQLVLAGKKEYYYELLQKQVNSGQFADRIIIPGFVSDEVLKWLYEHTSAYVFPSLSEGFGLPGLEAMTHGAPVISSNATCLPEVCGDAAHYFDPTNPGDIAEKIDEVLINDQLRQKLVAKGYEQVKKFSWRKMAEQTLEVYKASVN